MIRTRTPSLAPVLPWPAIIRVAVDPAVVESLHGGRRKNILAMKENYYGIYL
ncbi:MAG TPA: hypothetical protein VLX68_07800 [Chitinivibrionales bacterium]|nr:hypothetical protein [Chitinivibrionales bacterium]